MPTDKTADMADKQQNTLLRALLGLPESRQENAACQTSVPPVVFHYQETAQGRNTSIAPHALESATHLSAASSASKEIDQPCSDKVEVEPHPPAPSFRHEDVRSNERPLSYANQHEAQAADHIFNHGDDDKNSLRLTEVKPTPAEIISPAAPTQNTGKHTTPTTLGETARGQRHGEAETTAAKTTSAPPPLTGQLLPDKVTQTKTSPLVATGEIQISPLVATGEIQMPGVSMEKQVFPLLEAGPPVDLQAESRAQQQEASASLSEATQTHFLSGSIDTQSQQSSEQDTSSHTMGISATDNSLFRADRQENTQQVTAQKSIQAKPGEVSLTPATASLSPKMTEETLFTPQESTSADAEEIAELRQSFHRLMVKKLAEQQEQNKQHTASEEPTSREEEVKEQPAMQQVVVVQSNTAPRRNRQTAAFWERSYSGRSMLKMIR